MARIDLTKKFQKAALPTTPAAPPQTEPRPGNLAERIEQILAEPDDPVDDAPETSDTPPSAITEQLREEMLGLLSEMRKLADEAKHPLIQAEIGGLRFDDEQRRELLTLLGTADPESILSHVRNLVTFRAEDPTGAVSLPLIFSAQQLERTASRCAKGETLASKLKEFCDYGVNLQTGLA